MSLRKIDKFQMDNSIKLALKEDITSEDVSTNAIYKDDRLAEISLYSKGEGILAGLDVFRRVFELNGSPVFTEYKKDGDEVFKKDLILKIRDDVKALLSSLIQETDYESNHSTLHRQRCLYLQLSVLCTSEIPSC